MANELPTMKIVNKALPAPDAARLSTTTMIGNKQVRVSVPAAPAWEIGAPMATASKSVAVHFTDAEWAALETFGLQRGGKSPQEAARLVLSEWLHEHGRELAGGMNAVAAKSLHG